MPDNDTRAEYDGAIYNLQLGERDLRVGRPVIAEHRFERAETRLLNIESYERGGRPFTGYSMPPDDALAAVESGISDIHRGAYRSAEQEGRVAIQDIDMVRRG